jgi:hypothetical protein
MRERHDEFQPTPDEAWHVTRAYNMHGLHENFTQQK